MVLWGRLALDATDAWVRGMSAKASPGRARGIIAGGCPGVLVPFLFGPDCALYVDVQVNADLTAILTLRGRLR